MVSSADRPATQALNVVLGRLATGALTAWAAVTITFFALRLGAGDPVATLLSQGLATPAQADELRHNLGFDLPLLSQYARYLAGLLRADLGISLYSGRSVLNVIAEQAPSTIELASLGLLVAVALGLVLGVLGAWYERKPLGRAVSSLAGLATALPVAFTGIVALLLFMDVPGGPGSPVWTAFRRLLLPALVLGYASSGAIARVVQAGLGESLRSPFILAARARGVHRPLRLLWHALRPALPPAVSLSALEAAFLFGGTVVTETVFSRPGLGRLLVVSILQGDFPIAQGLVVLAALVYTASHVAADLVAAAIDPRLRGER
jgi:peptide/nickel transport system permease protein